MTDKKFEEALNAASNIVQGWPAWKQNSLLVTAMPVSPSPRQPINQPPLIPSPSSNAQSRTPDTGR